jgi:lipoprotein-anchoring transpeptidase ErfK/SrfK/LysM repeat protein
MNQRENTVDWGQMAPAPMYRWKDENTMGRVRQTIIRVTAIVLILGSTVSTAVEAASEVAYSTYVVQPGDTLIEIAIAYGLNVNELATANNINWDSWVYVGQVLSIPGGARLSDSSPAEATPASAEPDPRIPDPMPPLPVLPQGGSMNILSDTYARVVQANAPVYAHPSDVAPGGQPKRWLGAGYIWLTVGDKVAYDGHDYYEINPGEYVAAEALSVYSPSTFRGVALAAQPERPFAWILWPVQPRLLPGGEVNPSAPVHQRYELVQIFATEYLGSRVWYLIGPHQWIDQIYVGKVTREAPPAGISADDAWVDINLFEQTLAAYVGDQMVYATLVSSGLPGWDTPTGLFRVWLRVDKGKMSGSYNRPDYYYLEDVPWTQYFYYSVGLHTAYWHDGFGYRHSHGCVNLPPWDAAWLYEWAPQDLAVWVHAF